MQFSVTAILLLLPALAFASPAPASQPEADPQLNSRDVEITERDNIILNARDIVCRVTTPDRQPCRASRSSSSARVGWLNPSPATFGASCQKSGWYYVPAYACWVYGGNGGISCNSKWRHLLSVVDISTDYIFYRWSFAMPLLKLLLTGIQRDV